MSAWILSDKGIHRILANISPKELTFLGIDELCKENPKKHPKEVLGQLMVDMNYDAVNQRYNEKSKPHHFEYTSVKLIVPLIQSYKSLACYLYQCSEGDVPQRELFKKLRKICDSKAHEIINGLKEFENAKWG